MPKSLNIPPVYTLLTLLAVIILSYVGEWIDRILNRQAIGLFVMLFALFLLGWTILYFRKFKTTFIPRRTPSILIVNGPFAYSRNPIYLSMVLIAFGLGVYLGPMLAYLPSLVLALFLNKNYVIPEERKISEAFGKDGEHYIEKVPAWIGWKRFSF